jgi:hypothetical protein
MNELNKEPNLKCTAIVQSTKIRCSKKHKINGFCVIHWMAWYKMNYKCESVPEPWELLGFSVYPDDSHLSKDALTRIRTLLRNGPSEGQQDGHIYVYRMEKQTHDSPHMYKIGRTDQSSVHQRLKDWPGSELVHSWRTSHSTFAESLIHAFLDHWRVRRYVLAAAKTKPNKHMRFISTWYTNEAPVHDDVWQSPNCPDWMPDHIWDAIKLDKLTPEITYKTPVSKRYPVEIEFFYCNDYNYIQVVITNILEIISKNSSHWHFKFN